MELAKLQSDFELLLEAADILEFPLDAQHLTRLQQDVENETYDLVFWGGFDAGKSSLLNNLLGRELLPTQTQETTPFLTFIRYGVGEFARLYMQDGSIQEMTLEEARELKQHSSGNAAELVRGADRLELFVRDDLLKTGLVLVDTPGVDTIIESHERIAASMIGQLGKIVYVLGGSPTSLDLNYIRSIEDAHVEILFVRTKGDQLNAAEQPLDVAVQRDRETVEQAVGHPVTLHFLSNKSDDPIYTRGRQELISSIAELAAEIHASIQRSMELQLDGFRTRYAALLRQRLDELQHVNIQEAEKLEAEIAEAEKRLAVLYERMDAREAQWKLQSRHRLEDIHREVPEAEREFLWGARTRLSEAINVHTNEAQLQSLLNGELRNGFAAMKDACMAEFNGMVSEINAEYAPKLDASRLLPANFDEVTEVSLGDDDALAARRAAVRRCIEETTAKLEAQSVDAEHAKQMLAELQSTESALMQEMQEMHYTPQMVEVPGNTAVSGTMRMIGDMVDWLLVLIPGEGWAALAGKIAPKLGKAAAIAQKVGKAIGEADSLKDLTFALQNMSKTYETVKRTKAAEEALVKVGAAASRTQTIVSKTSGILDLLTFSHWFAKIGEQFDKPPHFEVDREYEAEYNQKKAEIDNRIWKAKQRELQLNAELGIYKTRQAEEEAKQQAQMEKDLRVDEELRKQEAELRESAARKAVDIAVGQCLALLEKSLKEAESLLYVEAERALDTVFENYCNARESELAQTYFAQVDRLEALRDAARTPGVKQKAIERISALLQKLAA